MNRFITSNALDALKNILSNNPESTAIQLISPPGGGFEIRSLFSKWQKQCIIISIAPLVVTDVQTMSQLVDGSIDYSSSAEEFIIKREISDVVHSYT